MEGGLGHITDEETLASVERFEVSGADDRIRNESVVENQLHADLHLCLERRQHSGCLDVDSFTSFVAD